MAKVSVLICCANAASTLPAALASAAWADEVVVVDSGSTDATAAIAQAGADRYVAEPWRGYAGQKVFGIELTRNDWVFILDGDEEFSSALAAEVQALTDAELDGLDLFWVPRLNYVMGRPVRAWSPDRLSRLMHRRRVTWGDEALHDTRTPTHPSRVRRLKGHLLHKRLGSPGFADYFSGVRLDERLLPVAREMHGRGKRVGFLGLLLRPLGAFFKFYVVKRGFLDGAFGLLIAQKALVSTQLKYAALWAVQNNLDRPDETPPDTKP